MNRSRVALTAALVALAALLVSQPASTKPPCRSGSPKTQCAPTNTAPPNVSGTAMDGHMLSASAGTWTGTPPLTMAYQWRRCDTSGAGCVNLAAMTAPSYTATPSDVGHTLRVLVTATNASGSSTATSAPTAAVAAVPESQPSFPIRAAFYYPWYPETWTVGGQYPHYTPSLGYYDSGSTSAVRQHVQAMEYGKIDVAISSWWGQATRTDNRFPTLLSETNQLGSPLRWTVYYEPEGSGDPTVSQLTSDLTYIRDRYGSDPAFFRVNGRFVVFVYADASDACAMADRWAQANTVGAYVVLKVFSGYRTCANQPDGWHQYSPAVAADSQSGYSYSISPGFYKANEATPRLARDLTRWSQNIRSMVASNAPFQLVTTFDEWGEGTPVESAQEWATGSGFGAYLDALHDDGAAPADTTPPTVPTGLVAGSSSQTSVSLRWDPSGDDVGVAGYGLYRGATRVGSSTGTSYTVGGLTCGTSYSVSVDAYDAAGNTSARSTALSLSTSACSSGEDPVVAAAGDIACDPGDSNFNGGYGTPSNCAQRATSDLLLAGQVGAVLTLGDNQYDDNTYAKYLASFDLSWGRVKSLIHPGIGNHEYMTAGAAGYFQYWGAAAGDPTKGYYSFDVGAWHMIALNSNCSQVGGCGAGSPQEQWLRADLAAHPNTCTLAYWHHPRFSSGQHGNNTSYSTFWQDLYTAGAEVVLNGHDHLYERFGPQTPGAAADPDHGIREFIVGTGGRNHYGFTSLQPNSEVRNSDTYGVLKLTLHAASYDWEFAHVAGRTFTDSGTSICH